MTHIRPATEKDAPQLRTLRNHYVEHSYSTFDEEPLTEQAIADWLSAFSTTGQHRLLVAEEHGEVLGFASSQQYRVHPAFNQTVETSVYVAGGQGKRGIGALLYGELFAALASEPVHCAVVGIALPNDASVALHKKFGFAEVGTFREYAIKHGQFISSLWMQRMF